MQNTSVMTFADEYTVNHEYNTNALDKSDVFCKMEVIVIKGKHS